MKTIYILSGLGADHRIFQNLDLGNNEIIHLPWLMPVKKESMEEYAGRIASCIRHEKPILIGLSFGGMMAMEVARYKTFEKIILLSSSKTRDELPGLYKLCGALRLQKLIPASFIKASKNIVARLFTARTSSEKMLIDQMLMDTDPVLLEWSIEKILYWKNKSIPSNVYHIHGTKDHVLPFRNISCTKAVKDGGHLMVMNRAEEISKLILGIVHMV